MKVEIRRVTHETVVVTEEFEMDIPEDVIAAGREAVNDYIWEEHWEYSDENAVCETVDRYTDDLDYENPGKEEDDS